MRGGHFTLVSHLVLKPFCMLVKLLHNFHFLPFFVDDLQNGISNHENSSNNIETIPTCIKEEEDFSKVTGPNKILTCPICKKKFKKGLNLKSHILLHKGKRKFKCNICQGLFTALDQLAKHKLSHQQGRTEGKFVISKYAKNLNPKITV